MDNDSVIINTQNYVTHACISLSAAIEEKEKEHAFLPSSKKTKLSQIQFLTNTETAFNKLSQTISKIKEKTESNNTLNTALCKLFLDLVQSLPAQAPEKESWREMYNIVDKLIRVFIAKLVAYNESLYNAYAAEWSILCQQHNLHIPFVQLNIIGLLNSLSEKRVDLTTQYLKQLDTFDWNKNFEAVFTKKSIRDRLYQIATLLIEQAGSVENLPNYLQKRLANYDMDIEVLIKIYEVYLNGIQRKLDLYRISYPEFTFDNVQHPIRDDVMLAQQRFQTIHGFITALVSSKP